MNHDFLTRAYLRHYAFLTRKYPRQQPNAIYHFATLAISGMLSLALLALMGVGFLLASHVLQRSIAPWNAPEWLILAVSAALVFLPGYFVDKKMEHLRVVRQDVIGFYGTRDQRRRWWLTVLLIIPLGGVVAVCFAMLRTSG